MDKLRGEEEEAEVLISDTCELLGKMLERAGAVFAPVFKSTFIPVMHSMLQPNEKDALVTCGLGLLSSLVEHTPDHVADLIPTAVERVVGFAQHSKDADVLQSCFYLMNVLLQYFGSHDYPTTQQFVEQALDIFTRYMAAAPGEDYADATCNAVSMAVTLLSLYFRLLSPQQLAQTVSCVVGSLPTGGDKIEARRVHGRLLAWVVQGHSVMQTDAALAQTIVGRLRSAAEDVLDEETRAQLANM